MAGRTTRNKIKYNVGRGHELLKQSLDRLVTAAGLADERSTVINEKLTVVIATINEADKALDIIFSEL